MEHNDISQALDYNTSRERLAMPEYGRNVLRMVDQLREIPDRAKRTEQAYAVNADDMDRLWEIYDLVNAGMGIEADEAFEDW